MTFASIRFQVETRGETEIIVGTGNAAGCALLEPPARTVIVVDETVAGLHGSYIEAIRSSWRDSHVVKVPGGESAKTPRGALELCRKLDTVDFSKSDALIGIGGGTITDLTAFTAHMYLRGLQLLLVPTTLLSQVDAAVGGKTGLNIDSRKNRIGSFYYPRRVICDTVFLKTLPQRQLLSGIAEIIKVHAVVDHRSLATWASWDTRRDDLGIPDWSELVSSSIKAKIELLSPDPTEISHQRLLNFGHTFAHAFEEISGFRLTHGEAVMLSMLCEAKIGHLAGACSITTYDAFYHVIDGVLSTQSQCFQANLDQISDALLATRRLRGGRDYLVVLGESGRGEFLIDVPPALARTAWLDVSSHIR